MPYFLIRLGFFSVAFLGCLVFGVCFLTFFFFSFLGFAGTSCSFTKPIYTAHQNSSLYDARKVIGINITSATNRAIPSKIYNQSKGIPPNFYCLSLDCIENKSICSPPFSIFSCSSPFSSDSLSSSLSGSGGSSSRLEMLKQRKKFSVVP